MLTPRQAELYALMPVKAAPDTSRFLLSPMPGLLVSLAVKEGQEVKAGEPLAVVEAMKMENVLRAQQRRHREEDKRRAARREPLAVDHESSWNSPDLTMAADPSGSDAVTLRLHIVGRVQGVGYRAWCVHYRRGALGLVGWVRESGRRLGRGQGVGARTPAGHGELLVARHSTPVHAGRACDRR